MVLQVCFALWRASRFVFGFRFPLFPGSAWFPLIPSLALTQGRVTSVWPFDILRPCTCVSPNWFFQQQIYQLLSCGPCGLARVFCFLFCFVFRVSSKTIFFGLARVIRQNCFSGADISHLRPCSPRGVALVNCLVFVRMFFFYDFEFCFSLDLVGLAWVVRQMWFAQ